MHIAPNTLRVASIFAVLTRLEPSKKAGMSLMKKLKLYDGEDSRGASSQKDIKELQDEAIARGHGRHLAALRDQPPLLARWCASGVTCINPIDALRALRDGLDQHTGITRERARAAT